MSMETREEILLRLALENKVKYENVSWYKFRKRASFKRQCHSYRECMVNVSRKNLVDKEQKRLLEVKENLQKLTSDLQNSNEKLIKSIKKHDSITTIKKSIDRQIV